MKTDCDQPVILIADSQIGALSQIKDSLSRELPGHRVITSDAGRTAMDILKRSEPSLVLADMRLSDMSGLKLLLKAKALCPGVVTIMTSDCGSQEARRMCLEAGVDFFMEKPIDVHRLTGLLGLESPDATSVFRGTLDNLGVPDVLQLILCRPSPMLMRLDSPHGAGGIEIENGNVIHARANGQVGEEAFYELVGWNEGNFEVVDVVCSEERTIALPLSQLLLKAAARDECGEDLKAAGETIQENVEPFFSEDQQAPDVGHVWAPMANYTRPQAARGRRQAGYSVETVRPDLPPIRAFRPRMETSQPLRVQHREPPSPRFEPVKAQPVRRRRRGRGPSSLRTGRRSVAPVGRRVLLASMAAALVVLVVARESGFLSSQYGRDMVPFLDEFIQEFIPGAATAPEQGAIRASPMYMEESPRIGDEHVQRTARKQISAPVMVYDVAVSADERLVGTPNALGVSEDVYKRHRFDLNPWVEVIGPTGKRVGAMVLAMPNSRSPILLNQSMYDTLSHRRLELEQVRLRKVQWTSASRVPSVAFQKSPSLPNAYCEYYSSVGVGLESMLSLGLTPGAHAVVRGPRGNTTVRVQLVDRGESDEIWLSQPVREAIGGEGEIGTVKLFPKT